MMNRERTGRRSGFTLTEVMISGIILFIGMAVAMASFSYIMRSERLQTAQTELDMEVRSTIEGIRKEMRLSAVDQIFLYPPGPGPYEAISYPVAKDDDGDGLLDMDVNGKIIWDRTVVYHIWKGTDPYELRKTIFEPRNNALTAAQRQDQINYVVSQGGGGGTHNGANADTTVVFKDLMQWEMRITGTIFDGYAAQPGRAMNVNLGSFTMSPGLHNFKFTCIGKNPSSSGYSFGVDSMVMSPSAYPREGEMQLPVVAQSGAAAVYEYRPDGSWGGNYCLRFPGTGAGDFFALGLENDRWEETNFGGTGTKHQNTLAMFSAAETPSDFVVSLDGLGWAWQAVKQTGDYAGLGNTNSAMSGYAVRALLRGGQMAEGGWIQFDGATCWVGFRSGDWTESGKLKIMSAYIAECADSQNPGAAMNAKAARRITFNGGNSGAIVNGFQWSDQLNFYIDKTKSYLVSYLISPVGENMGNPWVWRAIGLTNTLASSYLIPPASSPTDADLQSETWAGRTDLVWTNGLVGVESIYTTYPTNGFFTSQIFDTHHGAPAYSALSWDAGGYGTVRMRVRAGDRPDLSDAPDWTNIAAMASSGSISPGDDRYIQFQAELRPDSYGLNAPLLHDVTIRWPGETKSVDIGGTFSRGPDHGIYELRIDEQPMIQGVTVDLQIFRDVLLGSGKRRLFSTVKTEVQPLNSGR